jgi:hypothetical protein
MNFEGSLASAPNEICDFFTELIKRKYADDDWMYSDPGSDLLQDNPTFNAIQYTVDEVHNVFLELDVSKGASPDDIPPLILKNDGQVEAFLGDTNNQKRQEIGYIICNSKT